MKNLNFLYILFIVLIIIIIILLFLQRLYKNNKNKNISRVKENFLLIKPENQDINILQKNFQGESNLYSPYIYYKFKESKNFNLDNYF